MNENYLFEIFSHTIFTWWEEQIHPQVFYERHLVNFQAVNK